MADPAAPTPSSAPAAAEPTFTQGEAYTEERRPPPPSGKRLKHALLAAGAMLAVMLGGILVGLGGALSLLLGVAAFIGILATGGKDLSLGDALEVAGDPRRGGLERRRKLRRVLRAPGVDVPAAQERIDKVEDDLMAIDAVAAKLERPELETKIYEMTDRARVVLDELARNAGELPRAQKFMVAIVPSARRAVEKFAASGVRDEELDGRIGALMEELTEAAQRQFETLRIDDKIDLEVEMEVLADRLRQEA